MYVTNEVSNVSTISAPMHICPCASILISDYVQLQMGSVIAVHTTQLVITQVVK